MSFANEGCHFLISDLVEVSTVLCRVGFALDTDEVLFEGNGAEGRVKVEETFARRNSIGV